MIAFEFIIDLVKFVLLIPVWIALLFLALVYDKVRGTEEGDDHDL